MPARVSTNTTTTYGSCERHLLRTKYSASPRLTSLVVGFCFLPPLDIDLRSNAPSLLRPPRLWRGIMSLFTSLVLLRRLSSEMLSTFTLTHASHERSVFRWIKMRCVEQLRHTTSPQKRQWCFLVHNRNERLQFEQQERVDFGTQCERWHSAFASSPMAFPDMRRNKLLLRTLLLPSMLWRKRASPNSIFPCWTLQRKCRTCGFPPSPPLQDTLRAKKRVCSLSRRIDKWGPACQSLNRSIDS